ncbi:hypothetical protein D3C76_922420 [compost metagenome]
MLPLTRLDTMVPPAITIEIMPADPNEASISGCIIGQATPNKESGSPKLIKER